MKSPPSKSRKDLSLLLGRCASPFGSRRILVFQRSPRPFHRLPSKVVDCKPWDLQLWWLDGQELVRVGKSTLAKRGWLLKEVVPLNWRLATCKTRPEIEAVHTASRKNDECKGFSIQSKVGTPKIRNVSFLLAAWWALAFVVRRRRARCRLSSWQVLIENPNDDAVVN
jgi:hypothetical protein